MDLQFAKFALCAVMMGIGAFPVMLCYLNHNVTQKAKSYSFVWMGCWWVIPVGSMVKFIISN